MILSGTLAADRVAHAAAAARLSARLADLDERRRQAELAVDALRESWHGDATSQVGSRWHDWESSAHEAIDQLSALLGAIDLAREELEDVGTRSVPLPRQSRSSLG